MRFQIGQLVTTIGAQETFESVFMAVCLQRHMNGDWGTVCAEDKELNDAAITNGDRIMSSYTDHRENVLWIITEADRSSTTFMRPDEY